MQNKIVRFSHQRLAELRANPERGMAVAEYAIGIFVIAAVVLLGMQAMEDLVPKLMKSIIKAAFGKFD